MDILTIILFFIYTWGLGVGVTYFVKESKNIFERNLMRVGFGLGAFVVILTILNLLRIPLDWKIFLGLSLIFPAISLVKRRKLKTSPLKLTKANLYILFVIIITLGALFMYAGGAFKYPYLENDDPWKHTLGMKFVSEQKTAYQPDNMEIKYLDPYPPGYDGLFGILHQTTSSLYWTMKFFNALILSLGFIFFYFFAKEFTKNSTIAVFATFILASLPSFFTHFIWAHTMVIVLFFPTMYALERIRKDRNWMYPGMIALASVLLTQPSQAMKLVVMVGLYFLVRWAYERKFPTHTFIAMAAGGVISLAWWATSAASMIGQRFAKISRGAAADAVETANSGIIGKISFFIENYFYPSQGSATRPYSISDFLIAKDYGGINVHVGWGLVATILIVIGIILVIAKYKEYFKKKNLWVTVVLAWFVFTFLGVNSMTFNLPVGFFAFRFWLLLAIPAALLAGLASDSLLRYAEKYKVPAAVVVIVIIAGVFFFSGLPKYKQNTSTGWSFGVGFTSPQEVVAHTYFHSLPDNTKVFHYNNRTDIFTLGFDMYSCSWCPEIIEFREDMFGKDEETLYRFLKRESYEYIVIGGISYKYYMREYTENKTIETLQDLTTSMAESNHFRVAHQTQGAIIFKVV